MRHPFRELPHLLKSRKCKSDTFLPPLGEPFKSQQFEELPNDMQLETAHTYTKNYMQRLSSKEYKYNKYENKRALIQPLNTISCGAAAYFVT
jgi:hypothetical protein